jgi:putative endonuclease
VVQFTEYADLPFPYIQRDLLGLDRPLEVRSVSDPISDEMRKANSVIIEELSLTSPMRPEIHSMSVLKMNWQVYIVLCSDDSLYTGITTDLDRRLAQHAGGCGAKYFRGRHPVKTLYLETCHTRSSATRREAHLKKMTHDEKYAVIASGANSIPRYGDGRSG